MENWLITFLASILIWILFAGSFLFPSRKKVILSIVLAVGLSLLIKQLLPYIIRPFYEYGLSPLTLTIPFNGSFPSDHSAFVFALAASLWLKNKKVGLIYFLGALLVGWGRVASGVHYPIDIFGGAILGIFSALLVDTIFKKRD